MVILDVVVKGRPWAYLQPEVSGLSVVVHNMAKESILIKSFKCEPVSLFVGCSHEVRNIVDAQDGVPLNTVIAPESNIPSAYSLRGNGMRLRSTAKRSMPLEASGPQRMIKGTKAIGWRDDAARPAPASMRSTILVPCLHAGFVRTRAQAAALSSARASTRSRVMSKGVRISHHGDTALRRRERNWNRALSAGTVGANGT